MTDEELSALVKGLRDRFAESEKFTLLVSGQQRAEWQCIAALYARSADAITSLSASLANAERRAEEAESRALFFETEMTRILQEGSRK